MNKTLRLLCLSTLVSLGGFAGVQPLAVTVMERQGLGPAQIGLLSALWQRDVSGTGVGRVIDVNLVDSVFSLMEGMLPEYALDGRVRQPAGAALQTASPTNTYPCADGRWLCIAGNSDLIFARLMAAIGRPEMAGDPLYATNG